MENDKDKKDFRQDMAPAEDILIFELVERLEFGTPTLEPALYVTDLASCDATGCINSCGCDTNGAVCPCQP